MSRVWVISGVVLIGTGLALAGFGYWLAGNPNCDASDLGRLCVWASLATAIVGFALGVGGWLRLQRLGAGDEGAQREGAGWMPVGSIFAIALVGVVLLAVISPVAQLPVDVYAHPAPGPSAAPASFLPDTLAGHARTGLVSAEGERPGSVVSVAAYGAGISVRITRFNVTLAGGGVANASSQADVYLDSLYAGLDSSAGQSACAAPGGTHWYTQSGSSSATMAWQRENFVVQVTAPDAATRDAVAAALPI